MALIHTHTTQLHLHTYLLILPAGRLLQDIKYIKERSGQGRKQKNIYLYLTTLKLDIGIIMPYANICHNKRFSDSREKRDASREKRGTSREKRDASREKRDSSPEKRDERW